MDDESVGVTLGWRGALDDVSATARKDSPGPSLTGPKVSLSCHPLEATIPNSVLRVVFQFGGSLDAELESILWFVDVFTLAV